MTKTLTEQWKNGELKGGFYYLEMNDGLKLTDHTIYVVGEKVYRWELSSIDYVKEVLAPVPSYEEYKRLQEQLKEANEVIESLRTYDFTVDDEIAEEYQLKYGIAGKKIYTNKKPPKEFERRRKKITKSLEKKLKSGV